MASKRRVVRTPNGDVEVWPVTIHRAVLDRRKKPVSAAAHRRAQRDTNFWGATAKSKHERRSNAIRIAYEMQDIPVYSDAKPPRKVLTSSTPQSVITDTAVRKLLLRGWKIK